MKKILFLLLFCLIKLNAYQYLFCEFIIDNIPATYARYMWYSDPNGLLVIRESMNGQLSNISADSYTNLYYSKTERVTETHKYYSITEYLKNDPNFINDFFTQYPNQILNYFYNNNSFSNYYHLEYKNYEILYNSDGLAVESIVNGVWAGLYDNPQESGFLYNKEQKKLYYNGTPANQIKVCLFYLLRNFKGVVFSTLALNVFAIICAVIFVGVIFRFVVRLLNRVLSRTHLNFTFLKHW